MPLSCFILKPRSRYLQVEHIQPTFSPQEASDQSLKTCAFSSSSASASVAPISYHSQLSPQTVQADQRSRAAPSLIAWTSALFWSVRASAPLGLASHGQRPTRLYKAQKPKKQKKRRVLEVLAASKARLGCMAPGALLMAPGITPCIVPGEAMEFWAIASSDSSASTINKISIQHSITIFLTLRGLQSCKGQPVPNLFRPVLPVAALQSHAASSAPAASAASAASWQSSASKQVEIKPFVWSCAPCPKAGVKAASSCAGMTNA